MRFPFTLLLAFLLLGGCTAGKSVLPSKTAGFPSPAAALSAINPVEDTNTLYQVTAKVSLTSPQGKMSSRLAVIMQYPDKLRIESLPVIGPPDFFLTTKGDRFKVYLPGNQEFITGAASPNNLSRFLPLAWSAERWLAVLMGNRPGASFDTEDIRGMMEGQLYRVDVLGREAIRESLWINPETRHLEKLEYINPEGLKNTVRFSAFRKMDGRDFPERITIDTDEETTIRIIYETLEVKKEVNNDFFELLPPPEAVIRNLPD